jgi:hypothetical protein
VRVGGEHVAAEADLLDLVFRRQTAAAEAVDAQHGAGARHVAEGLFHFVRIVGQFVDLRLVEHRGERIAAWVAGALARVAPDLHGFGELRNLQLRLAAVVAGAQPDVAQVERLEAGRLHVNCVAARFEGGERRVAACARVERQPRRGTLAPALSLPERHAGADDDRAARIDDRNPQRGIGRRLRERRERQQQHRQATHQRFHIAPRQTNRPNCPTRPARATRPTWPRKRRP